MDQPTPKVTRNDVERVVRRDFGLDMVSEVLSILDEYGTEDYHRERDRVQLSVLKLAGGNRENLIREVALARSDYRDTLLAAEYPICAKKIFRMDRLPDEELKKIYDADWKRYTEWLTH